MRRSSLKTACSTVAQRRLGRQNAASCPAQLLIVHCLLRPAELLSPPKRVRLVRTTDLLCQPAADCTQQRSCCVFTATVSRPTALQCCSQCAQHSGSSLPRIYSRPCTGHATWLAGSDAQLCVQEPRSSSGPLCIRFQARQAAESALGCRAELAACCQLSCAAGCAARCCGHQEAAPHKLCTGRRARWGSRHQGAARGGPVRVSLRRRTGQLTGADASSSNMSSSARLWSNRPARGGPGCHAAARL